MHRWCKCRLIEQVHVCNVQERSSFCPRFQLWRGQLSLVVTSGKIQHGDTGQRSADMTGRCGRPPHVKTLMLSQRAHWEILRGERRMAGSGRRSLRRSRPHLCWNHLKMHFIQFCLPSCTSFKKTVKSSKSGCLFQRPNFLPVCAPSPYK